MTFYDHTHQSEKIARKALFRINGITYEEMFENLYILLDNYGSYQGTSTIANLPTNKDVEKVLMTNERNNNDNMKVEINKMVVVVWQNCDNHYEWFIGYIKDVVMMIICLLLIICTG